jgi:hypothetical protein
MPPNKLLLRTGSRPQLCLNLMINDAAASHHVQVSRKVRYIGRLMNLSTASRISDRPLEGLAWLAVIDETLKGQEELLN